MKNCKTVLGLIFVVLITAFSATAQIKPADLVGEYQSNTGTVRITYGEPGAKTVDFRVTIQTDNGCEGEVEGIANPVAGKKNSYVWEEKLAADKNYGKNARYRIELSFISKNKVIVKERSLSTNRDVTIYRGTRCTFNGTFTR